MPKSTQTRFLGIRDNHNHYTSLRLLQRQRALAFNVQSLIYMKVASGCPQFCKVSYLDDQSYTKDDSLFIKSIVHTDWWLEQQAGVGIVVVGKLTTDG